MTTRDIVDTFEEMYGATISAAQVSNITEAVMEKIIEWQARPLDEVYPIIYLDCIVVKIKQDKRVINKAIYVALGVNMAGQKELLDEAANAEKAGLVEVKRVQHPTLTLTP